MAKSKRMNEADLKSLLAAHKSDALQGMSVDKLSSERTSAMKYYVGDMADDMPTIEGQSKAVSTDVADTIEGMMPTLMDIFCGGDEVVRFQPVGAEDVEAAEQETAYVNHVFMQKNPGFLILYSFIKDSLLSKVGIVKPWWEEIEKEEKETYYNQPDDAYAILAGQDDVELTEHTEKPMPGYSADPLADPMQPEAKPPMLHDLTIVRKKKYGCAKVEPVPPEEFGIARRAKNIQDSGYCFHEVIKTESDLIDQGYDATQIRELPTYTESDTYEKTARDTVEESGGGGDEGMNKALRPIRVTEHYVKMDYEGNGKAQLYRVTTGGEEAEILNRVLEGDEDKKETSLDVVQVDFVQFAAMTPVIMTHRFFGRSIADLVMDIQRIKTALLRAGLDNAYLSNFPRPEIAESHAGDNTIDDLLIWRAGAPIRTKSPGGLNWQTVPNITGNIFPLMQYLDATREMRTGITRQSQGVDADALQNQSATAVNQLYSAAQMRIKLIARIFAETGVKDLFSILHALIRKHGSVPETIRLRNQWITVDPRQWKERDDMTINVGLGSGGRAERLQQLMVMINQQKEARASGSMLVTDKNLYNSAKELTKLVDIRDTENYFTDPTAPDDPKNPRPQPPQDPKLIQIQAQAEIEKLQAQADIETARQKAQNDSLLAQQRQQLELQQSRELHEMKMTEMRASLAIKLAGSANKPSAGSENGGEAGQQGNGVDMGALAGLLGQQPSRGRSKRVQKQSDGSWLIEEMDS